MRFFVNAIRDSVSNFFGESFGNFLENLLQKKFTKIECRFLLQFPRIHYIISLRILQLCFWEFLRFLGNISDNSLRTYFENIFRNFIRNLFENFQTQIFEVLFLEISLRNISAILSKNALEISSAILSRSPWAISFGFFL